MLENTTLNMVDQGQIALVMEISSNIILKPQV